MPLEDKYIITPICFSIDSATGMILSHSFSYGLPQTNLHSLGVLALREKLLRPTGSPEMFRSTSGDLSWARRKLEMDHATLDLQRLRCPQPNMYDWSKGGALLGHLFYDWSYDFLSELDNYQVIKPAQLIRLLAHTVECFNLLIETSDIDVKLVRKN